MNEMESGFPPTSGLITELPPLLICQIETFMVYTRVITCDVVMSRVDVLLRQVSGKAFAIEREVFEVEVF